MSAASNAQPQPIAKPAPQRIRNLIAVASGKGGVGKTWFSVTLSHTLARQGDKTLLIDGDLGLANVDVQLGLTPKHDLAGVIAGTVPLKDAVSAVDGGARSGRGFDVLAGRSGSGALDVRSGRACARCPHRRTDLADRRLCADQGAQDPG